MKFRTRATSVELSAVGDDGELTFASMSLHPQSRSSLQKSLAQTMGIDRPIALQGEDGGVIPLSVVATTPSILQASSVYHVIDHESGTDDLQTEEVGTEAQLSELVKCGAISIEDASDMRAALVMAKSEGERCCTTLTAPRQNETTTSHCSEHNRQFKQLHK